MSIPTTPVIPTAAHTLVDQNAALSRLAATARQTNSLLFAKELALAGQAKTDSNGQQVNTTASNSSRLAVYAPASAGATGASNASTASSSKSTGGAPVKRRRKTSVSKKR